MSLSNTIVLQGATKVYILWWCNIFVNF